MANARLFLADRNSAASFVGLVRCAQRESGFPDLSSLSNVQEEQVEAVKGPAGHAINWLIEK